MARSALLAALLAAAACNGGSGDRRAFGIDQRTVVTGLTFPTGVPSPEPMNVVRAFPGLGFTLPLYLAAPPDGTDRLFVVEQGGAIYVFDNDDATTERTLFLDLRPRLQTLSLGNEEGLLGLAFHPQYATNRRFYVYYTQHGPRRSVLSRWTASTGDPDVADAASEEILLEVNQPFSNHNAGCLQFGPDGMLYVALGDGGSANDPNDDAQDRTTLLGSLLRLTPDGGVPADNPVVGDPAGARPEIWAYGLRNPWRFSFDRDTGDLWLGDVGQNAWEEIDRIERGGNYGWRVLEGTNPANGSANTPPGDVLRPPVWEYSHGLGLSVTGGYVYRGAALPTLRGAYVYADFASGRVWALVHDGAQVVSNTQIATASNPASFGEDEAGELYLVSRGGGIYRFEEQGGPAPGFPQRLSDTGLFADTASLTAAPGVVEYEVNAELWSDGARKRRWIALPGTAGITFDATGNWTFPQGTVLVKHFELDVAPGSVRRLETRVLVHQETGWAGYTYRWNGAQTDADLLADAATDTFTVEDPAAPGGTRQQEWRYPSRTDCMTCHTEASGRVLGVRTGQLNRERRYAQVTDNQLRTWNHLGLFTTDIGDAAQYPAFAEPADASAPVADRARAYLAANCAGCHRPGGPTPSNIDLRYLTPLAQTNTVDQPATDGLGLSNPAIVRTGVKESSTLWERLRRTDGTRMPPLSSVLVDGEAVDLVGEWIDAGPD